MSTIRTFVSIVMALAMSGPAIAQTTSRAPTISTAGSVDVLVPPTSAVLILTLLHEGVDIGAATLALDSAAARLHGVVERRGVSLIPWGGGYGGNPAVRRMLVPGQIDVRTTRDYLARAGLALAIPSMPEVGEIVREIAAAQIDGSMHIVFQVDETDAQLRTAYGRAVSIAHQRAAAMAEAMGGRLGELVSVSTPTGMTSQQMQRYQLHDGVMSPLPPSDVLYRVSVNGTWAFVER